MTFSDGRKSPPQLPDLRIEQRPIKSLKLRRNNPRTHSDKQIRQIAASIETPGDHLSEVGLLKTQIKEGMSKYLYEETRRRPMIFPVVIEV